jgi:hypothetical protein
MIEIMLHHPIWLLGLLCLAPMFLGLIFSLAANSHQESAEILAGNPLLSSDVWPASEALKLDPLLHLLRSGNAREVRQLTLGMRHTSLAMVTPFLMKLRHHPDPEVQLHAQVILQQKQERLRAAYDARVTVKDDPSSLALLADQLEATLTLLRSPFTQRSEHAMMLTKVRPLMKAATHLSHSPRLLMAAARLHLWADEFEEVLLLMNQLPQQSPLREALVQEFMHRKSIHLAACSTSPDS